MPIHGRRGTSNAGRNGIVENCLLHENGLINHYLEGATNIQIRYNKIWKCTYNAGIEFGLETSTYHNDGVRIYDNLFWDNAGGVSFWAAGSATAQTRNISIYNNTFFGNGEAIRFKAPTDNYSGRTPSEQSFWQNSTGIGRSGITTGQQRSAATVAYNAFNSAPTNHGLICKVISIRTSRMRAAAISI
jgi:hypothetical protein